MLIIVGMIISISAAIASYFGCQMHTLPWWYGFFIILFSVTYFVFYLNVYWLIALIGFLPYRNKEFTGKVNRFCLFNVRLTSSFCLTLRRIGVKKENFNLMPEEASLVLFNHVSDYDPWVLYKIMRGKYVFVGKKALRNIPMVKSMASSIGTLYVEDNNKENNYLMVDRAVSYIKDKNVSVVIAPEGTRNRTGELLPFKHGGFNIALRSECPIVLVGFKNMEKAVEKKNMKKVNVHVEIFDIIKPEEYKGKAAREVAEMCENKYKEYLGH